jgi:NAD(P)H-dependent FMN reductase
MPHLQVITASTRPSRKGPAVAAWFLAQAREHGKFEIEPVDLAEAGLPLLDEPKHPKFGDYEHAHTRAWSETIDRADAFVVVTPEYDHGPPAALINALQYLVIEWAYKPMGFVSYGGVSAGTRSANTLKMTATTLKMMPMFEAVAIPFFAQHIDEETGTFAPGTVQEDAATLMLDELLRWAEALRPLRRGG